MCRFAVKLNGITGTTRASGAASANHRFGGADTISDCSVCFRGSAVRSYFLPETRCASPRPEPFPMSSTLVTEESAFIDRRDPYAVTEVQGRERRQFVNSHDELSPDAGELARAIDSYKLSQAVASPAVY
jgi:hypothetical protein